MTNPTATKTAKVNENAKPAMRRRPPSRNINIRYPLPLFEALSAEAKVRNTTVSRVVVEIAAQEVARRNRLGEHFLNDYDIYSDRDAKANENAAIAAVIAGAPQPNPHPKPQPDALTRIAAALEAQTALLVRLADAIDDVAAVAVGAEAGLRQLVAQLDNVGGFSVWGEEDADAGDPLEIPL